MHTKRLIFAAMRHGHPSVGTDAGPCDTSGRAANLNDAGSGPASTGFGQTTGMTADTKEHPPIEHDDRATGDVATCRRMRKS